MRRLWITLTLVGAGLAAFLLAHDRGPVFHRLRSGERFPGGWTAEGSVLVDEKGRTVSLGGPRQEALEVATLETGGEHFLVTRFEGEGSSGATYYSFYRLGPELAAIPAAETRDYSPDDPDAPCRKDPRVEAPPKDPSTIFGACSNPEWRDDSVVFRMPGYHCSRWQTGGCPSEQIVRLR